MNRRLTIAMAGTSLALLSLTACGEDDSAGDVPAKGSAIGTSESSLGTIVVDGNGMTAYVFDQDEPGSGKSSCAGGCAEEWPAITSTADQPKVDGVTGEVGTIAGTDGAKQVTLEGLPLYTYAGDGAVGDTQGQGKGGVWWVVSPAGEKITKTATTDGGGGY
ncbi:COG4315 family predicted lipoprotein [Aeromicrobium sp.]|uniref:COG4315 family predicted lipoprotein n=1 Tax=Aeromicrobium sp. TaxID=1871063 RepID=UPI002FC6B3CD